MITQVYKERNAIKLLPIRAIQLFSQILYLDPYDANLIIYHTEKESNYKLTPITKIDDEGKSVVIGYKFEANIYVSYNDYINNNLIYYLDEIFKGRYTFSLCLGNAVPWTDEELELEPPPIINSTGGMRISIANGMSHNYEIEGVEYRPRMIIHFNATLKGKLLSSPYIIFI